MGIISINVPKDLELIGNQVTVQTTSPNLGLET